MIDVLNALRKTHADDLVPIALYLCAQLPPRVLLSGQRRCDGGVATVGSADMARRSARMAIRLFADAPNPRCRGRCRVVVKETLAAVVGASLLTRRGRICSGRAGGGTSTRWRGITVLARIWQGVVRGLP